MGFCVKCGKKGIKGSLCKKCTLEENPLAEKVRGIREEICRECNAYDLHGRWHDSNSLKESLRAIALDSLKGKVDPNKVKINPKLRTDLLKKGKRLIDMEIISDGETYVLPAEIIFIECPRCSRKRSAYFEAVLQVRNPNQQILDFVYKRLESKEKSGIFATDIKEVTNGVDFYITNKKYTMRLGNLLQSRFFGILKTSAKLFTRDKNTQADIYRVNVLFKALDAHPGDIVKIGEEEVKIMEVRGDRIQGRVVGKKKKVFIDEQYVK